MNWEDAKKACADLGEGWKLPSNVELNYLYQNRFAFGGFAPGAYWSSTEFDSSLAWYQYFYNGNQFYFIKFFTISLFAPLGLFNHLTIQVLQPSHKKQYKRLE